MRTAIGIVIIEIGLHKRAGCDVFPACVAPGMWRLAGVAGGVRSDEMGEQLQDFAGFGVAA